MLEGVVDIKAQLEKAGDIISKNDLKVAEESVLVELINMLSNIGEGLDAIEGDLNDVDALIKELSQKVSGLDSEAAMKANEDRLTALDERLSSLQDELVKLLKLTKQIDPEATDDEEGFIQKMGKDLQQLKKAFKGGEGLLKKAWTLLHSAQDNIAKKTAKADLKPADIQAITSETAKVSHRVDSVEKEIQQIAD